jgi:hypothetical protein
MSWHTRCELVTQELYIRTAIRYSGSLPCRTRFSRGETIACISTAFAPNNNSNNDVDAMALFAIGRQCEWSRAIMREPKALPSSICIVRLGCGCVDDEMRGLGAPVNVSVRVVGYCFKAAQAAVYIAALRERRRVESLHHLSRAGLACSVLAVPRAGLEVILSLGWQPQKSTLWLWCAGASIQTAGRLLIR